MLPDLLANLLYLRPLLVAGCAHVLIIERCNFVAWVTRWIHVFSPIQSNKAAAFVA